MSRIREDLRVIPPLAWAIAIVAYVGFVTFAWFVLMSGDPDVSPNGWIWGGRAVFAGVVPLIMFVLVLLIGYVNGDARRRGMRHVLWTLLAIFIPNAIGIILYFVLRDPPMRDCPKCGKLVRSGFAFCPVCGTALTETCPGCLHAVEPGWSHCPSCGRGLRAA